MVTNKLDICILRSLVAVLSCILIACGGGGGGSSSGGTGGGSIGRDADTGVRVLHAAIDGTPVDLISSVRSGPLETKIRFVDAKGYRSLPFGEQSISITRALNPDVVLASFPVTSSGNDAYSILLYGDAGTSGLKTKLIKDSPPLFANSAAVRFVNGATAAASLRVNVTGWNGGARVIQFGDASEYAEAPAGVVRVVASRSNDGRVAAVLDYNLLPGRAYTVLIGGEVGYYSKGVVFQDR
jgi:hypothetical protein